MTFRALGLESPYPKYGAILWDSGYMESYEEVLLAAANYMSFISEDYDGSSYNFFYDYLRTEFGVDECEQEDNETYVDWMRRATGRLDLSEKDMPYDDRTGVMVFIKDIDKQRIINQWDGEPIFHPTKGFCNIFYPCVCDESENWLDKYLAWV